MGERFQKEKEYTIENYKYAGELLSQIDKLIDDKESKDLIQARYKELKVWFKGEYNKVSKYNYNDGYISQWYGPMVTDIFVTSFDMAKTNSTIDKIKLAVFDALSYYGHWDSMLRNYEKQGVYDNENREK